MQLRIRPQRLIGFDGIGLPFEEVVAVRTATLSGLPDIRQRVGRQEEQAPLFVLSNMHMLMRPECAKLCLADAKDDMAQCHGAKAKPARKTGQATASPATMKLGDTRHESQPSTKAQHGETRQSAKRRIGRCPSVGN